MIATLLAIKKWWYARQRRLDLECLWTACLDMTSGDGEAAKDAFAMHCLNDPAWRELGEDGIIEFIENLGLTDLPVANRRTLYSENNDPRLDADYQPPPRNRGRLSRPAPPTLAPSGLRRPPD